MALEVFRQESLKIKLNKDYDLLIQCHSKMVSALPRYQIDVELDVK